MIHASKYKPRIFPIAGLAEDSEIDRAQGIDPTVSLNREKVNEIGRVGAVGYLKNSPTTGYRLTQYEYGNIEFWQKLIGTTTLGGSGQTGITLSDFKTAYFDICGYLTDDDDTFLGTKVYPALRTSGFSISIGDPQAIVERSFDFVGEDYIIWQGNNKYYIYGSHTAGSGGDDEIYLGAKAPIQDPDTSSYMYRVVRVSSGVTTELVETTDYTYSNVTKKLTIISISASDEIKYWYSSSTAPDTQFTDNDVDVAGVIGDSVSIYLYVPASGKPEASDYLYRVQSISLDVSFDREDLREIGNKNVVQRGIKSSTVTATIGRILESFTIEEVLRGEAADYGKIDVNEFGDDSAIIIKVFDDNDKGSFKYGFKATGLSPTEVKGGPTVDEYVPEDTTLEGEDLTISADVSVIGI